MRHIIIAMMLLVTLIVPVSATELASPDVDELYEEAEIYGIDPDGGFENGLLQLLNLGRDAVDELLHSAARTGVSILAIVLLCGLMEGAGMGQSVGSLAVVPVAGALAISALSMGEMSAMIGLGRGTIQNIEGFSGVLLPVMATVTAATGKVTTAAVRQGATILFSQLLISLINGLLIPMVYAYLTACCAYAAVGNEGLKKMANLIKNVVTGILTIFMLGFVAYLAISGAIAGTADAATIKVARMAMNRAIPVVGGILSDAAETILVGAGVLRASVGVVGLLVVLAICIVPFLHLGVHYLTFKVTAALSATVASPRLTGLIEQISSGFGLVLGMTGACALLLMISLVSAVVAVTG